MGLAGYYRDFIPNFAALAAPLSDLTRKGQHNKVEWGEAQEKAYQSIKALNSIASLLAEIFLLLCHTTVLAQPMTSLVTKFA